MARNLAEKMRRDKLNTHINELSTLVPMVAGSSKKMDKTSILRLSATYIRMNKSKCSRDHESIWAVTVADASDSVSALKPDKNWKLLPKEFGTINLSQYLMEVSAFLETYPQTARTQFPLSAPGN